MSNEKIDFVIMWVDGNDTEWQKEKNKYNLKSNADGEIYRYRDWDLLQYWFRGVEKNAPWVNKIHFVTYGHIPKWLNTNNPKLNIVNHKDFIPNEYLPTFSANSIENNLHRIKGLSENFVFFNDDFYLIKSTKPTDFFKKGIPLDTAVLNVHCPKKSLLGQHLCINDVNIINEHFDFKKSIKENFFKWFNTKNGYYMILTILLLPCSHYFPGFYQHHVANSYTKSTFKEVWKKEYEILNNTCMHKFRETTDVNQWVFREWQIASGNFKPRSKNFGKSFCVDKEQINKIKNKIINTIVKKKCNIISINDGPITEKQYNDLIFDLKKSFNKILPDKSSFEK